MSLLKADDYGFTPSQPLLLPSVADSFTVVDTGADTCDIGKSSKARGLSD